MTQEQFEKLQPGEMVRHKKSGDDYAILRKMSDGTYTAVRYTVVVGFDEWERCTWPLHDPLEKPN